MPAVIIRPSHACGASAACSSLQGCKSRDRQAPAAVKGRSSGRRYRCRRLWKKLSLSALQYAPSSHVSPTIPSSQGQCVGLGDGTALRVQVFDAQNYFAAAAFGIEPGQQAAEYIAQMQKAAGGRRKASYNAYCPLSLFLTTLTEYQYIL